MTQPIPSASDASASLAPSTAPSNATHDRTVDMRSPYFFKLDHKAPALPTRPGTVLLATDPPVSRSRGGAPAPTSTRLMRTLFFDGPRSRGRAHAT